MSGSRSFRIFRNHFTAVSFHAKSRGYDSLKYYDCQFKRFYRIFVYTVFMIVVCVQNHEMATRAYFRYWSILWVALGTDNNECRIKTDFDKQSIRLVIPRFLY